VKKNVVPYSRSQALIIWRHIAQGVLIEPGNFLEGTPPSMEYVQAIEFLTHVAVQIIEADESSAVERPRKLMNALHLQGKTHPDEDAFLKAIDVIDDFGLPDSKTFAVETAQLARGFINRSDAKNGRVRSADARTDAELKRQIREVQNRKKQDKK
jgi:hypothetical protein